MGNVVIHKASKTGIISVKSIQFTTNIRNLQEEKEISNAHSVGVTMICDR